MVTIKGDPSSRVDLIIHDSMNEAVADREVRPGVEEEVIDKTVNDQMR